MIMVRFQGTKTCVRSNRTKTRFNQRAFLMYHSTHSPEAAESILSQGFRCSSAHNNMLGKGIYVSANLNKCLNYGPITFKLLVYPGLFKPIRFQGDPEQKSWQENYGSAWVPPNCGMVPSGLEVTNLINHTHYAHFCLKICNLYSLY